MGRAGRRVGADSHGGRGVVVEEDWNEVGMEVTLPAVAIAAGGHCCSEYSRLAVGQGWHVKGEWRREMTLCPSPELQVSTVALGLPYPRVPRVLRVSTMYSSANLGQCGVKLGAPVDRGEHLNGSSAIHFQPYIRNKTKNENHRHHHQFLPPPQSQQHNQNQHYLST